MLTVLKVSSLARKCVFSDQNLLEWKDLKELKFLNSQIEKMKYIVG